MKNATFVAFILTAIFTTAAANEPAPSPPPKGTVCFTYSLRSTEAGAIACKSLGKFSSVADIYERGYRVVTSGVLNEPGGTVFLIIEERK